MVGAPCGALTVDSGALLAMVLRSANYEGRTRFAPFGSNDLLAGFH